MRKPPVWLGALASAVLLLAVVAAAEQPEPPAETEAIEVVVTASGFEESAGETGCRVTAVDEERIKEKGGQTLPDALNGEAGVWVQKTSMGHGSPIIRGFIGKHVLTLIDGVRFNNATFRFGPNQYLNTIDFSVLERFEVLHGPGSVIYGSDAVGGVMNVLTWPAEAEMDKLQLGSRLFAQFSTANQGVYEHYSYGANAGDLWHLLGATYMSYRNLRAGRGESPIGVVDVDGVQPQTNYEGGALRLSMRYAPVGEDEWRTFFTATRQVDVPRTDKLLATDRNTNPEEIYSYDPQELEFGYIEWRRHRIEGDYRMNLSLNRQEEGRVRRKAGWTKVRYEKDEIQTAGFVFSMRRPSGAGELVAGAEVYNDWIASSRKEVADGTGIVTVESPRFPDGTTYLSSGVFADYQFAAGATGIVDLGLRYSLFRFDADFGGLVVGSVGPLYEVERTYQDFAGEVSYTQPVSENAEWYASIARGFRAPNVDDLAVSGDWSSGNDIPNPDLDPERVMNYEFGLKAHSATQRAALSIFYAACDDLIARTYVDPGADGIPGTSDDLYQFQNINEAVTTGAELAFDRQVRQDMNTSLRLSATAAYVHGQNQTANEPLSKVPPFNGTIGARLEEAAAARWWCEFFIQWADKQDRLSSSDQNDKRIPVGGTPGWATLNLRGGLKLSDNLTLNLALLNLGDKRYRSHASGMDAPGFGAVLSLDARF